MRSDKRIHNIMLKILSTQISRAGEDEQVEFITEGKYYQKNNAVYLVYQETEVLGIDGNVTTLKIRDEKVRMKRYGPVNTEMYFEQGKRVTGEYETPFGSMPMELLTNQVINQLNQETGKGMISIDYDLSIRGLAGSHNRLNVEILEGGADVFKKTKSLI